MKPADNNLRFIAAFSAALAVDAEMIVPELRYNGIPQWDSIGHMALVAALEDAFDIMLDTQDILDMSSVAKAKEILSGHGVHFA